MSRARTGGRPSAPPVVAGPGRDLQADRQSAVGQPRLDQLRGSGSPAYFEGTFSDDGDTMTGEWVYPGGGGYESTMTRIRS